MSLRIPRGGRSTSRLLVLGTLVTAGFALAACSTIVSRHPVGNASVPEPKKPVALRDYLGRWYEIARYEQSFQRGCKGVTADYSLRADGGIDVLNRCRKDQGKISAARGRAKVVDAQTGAKLKVSFFGPFYGDYWVLDHADDYSWSIVGEPSGRYLWILHREPTPPEADVQQLIERAGRLGYDTSMLLRTEQP
jgi:apolipoprotein D and lipocalin family protein